TVLLGRDGVGETLALGFAEPTERFIVEGRVKSDPGRVQMLDNGNVQTLLCDQHFDVAAAKGSGNGGSNERLGKKAARERERLDRRFVGALAALDSGKALYPDVGKTAGTEDEAAAGRLF